jgi:alkylation response protein AidB-like acyl-CoA dehydrogenase
MFFRIDERDARFVLFEHIKVQELLKLPAFRDHAQETLEMVVAEAARFAREVVQPLNVIGDREGAKFENGKVRFPKAYHEAYRAYCEGGWIASGTSPEWGGQGLPAPLAITSVEFFIGACPAFVVNPMLAHSAAHVLESFASQELKQVYCPKMYAGEWAGTMCLTEPQAGSALGDLKTQAQRAGDHYLLTGTKIFITSGEHDLVKQICHLVLARVEGAPAGIKGVSLFLVPKYLVQKDGSLGERNDVRCLGIEEKMGLHGSATCTMGFGEDGHCVGYLIGKENEGIKLMFQMMNEARIYVGLQGLGIASAAYELALDYAKQRVQGTDAAAFKDPGAPRVPIIRHPDVRRMLTTMKALVEGLRALIVRAGAYSDLAEHGPEEDRAKYQGFLELLTPVCKAYGSEAGFRICDMAMLTLGGYGYIREYGVEQYMRDVKIASIYEGTNGIQAIDLIARKVPAKGGLVFMQFLQEVNTFIDRHKSHPRLGHLFPHLEQARDTIARITMKFGELNMSGDLYYPLLHATPYLHSFGEFILGWLLLEQAVVADEKLQAMGGNVSSGNRPSFLKQNPEGRFYDAKIKTAEFFVTTLLPEVHARAAAVDASSRAALDIVFEGE